MKAYLMTTGSVFGLLTIVHVWRMAVETGSRNPWLILITLISALLAVWAGRLLRTFQPAP